MSQPPVSLHPYFKANDEAGLAAFKALMPKFIERTSTEAGCLYYDFTINGDEVYCREAYTDASATLAHLENVGAVLEEAMTHAPLTRLEVHGPAAELDKLREPFAGMSPVYFTFEAGV